jgi:hypothetical protein
MMLLFVVAAVYYALKSNPEPRMGFFSSRWACFPCLVSCSDMFNVLVSNVFAGRRTRSVVCVYVSVCVVCAAGDHFSSAGRKKCSGSAADGELRVPRI